MGNRRKAPITIWYVYKVYIICDLQFLQLLWGDDEVAKSTLPEIRVRRISFNEKQNKNRNTTDWTLLENGDDRERKLTLTDNAHTRTDL